MPSLIIPDHRIEDRQELAHTSCDGDFLELALRQQALIELFLVERLTDAVCYAA